MHAWDMFADHSLTNARYIRNHKQTDRRKPEASRKRKERRKLHQHRSNQSRLDPRVSLNASLANQRHTSCTSLPTRQLPKTTPCCSRTSFARSHRRRQSSSRRLGRGAGGAPADSLTLLLLVRAVEGLDVDVAGRRTLPGVGGHRRSEAN